MNLYHYTPKHNLGNILKTGKIRKGMMVQPNGLQVIKNGAVSLTTDPTPLGHGLPDGRKMNAKEADYVKNNGGGCEVINGETFSIDMTKFRLKISIPESDPLLKKTSLLYNPKLLRALEVSAYYPVSSSSSVTDFEIALLEVAFGNGSVVPKGDTWWYYFDEISTSCISAIGVKENGKYIEFSPQNFLENLK